MKKIFLYITLGIALSFIAVSCSENFLDEKPFSSYSSESLNDADGIEALLKGLYYNFGELYTWSSRQGWNCCWQVGTDVCSPGHVEGVEIGFYNYDELNSENDAVNYLWSQSYLVINNANNILKTIGENGDPAKIAEARFFRGYIYDQLVTFYGAVPLLTEPTTSARTNYERTPVSKINEQIEQDLIYAAAHLPSIKSTVTETRANNAMAMQALATYYLRVNEPAKAELELDSIFLTHDYSLITSRYGIDKNKKGDYFHDMFIYGNQRRSQGNTEAIWIFELDYNAKVAGGYTNAPQQRRVWVPSYHNVPGMTYSVFDESLGSNVSEYGGRGNGRIRPSNWVKYQLYKDGDMRNSEYNITRQFYYNSPGYVDTIGIDSQGFRVGKNDPTAVKIKVVHEGDSVVIARGDTIMSMYPYTRKWDSFDPNDTWGWACVKDIPIMRLGETYLLRAEARFKQGNTQGAADDINVLRDRAFKEARIRTGNPDLGKVSASDINMDFILDERARELFAEENRRYTLVRTGTLVERAALNTESTIVGKITGLDNHNLLLPIPLSEIKLNNGAKWEQNPGY